MAAVFAVWALISGVAFVDFLDGTASPEHATMDLAFRYNQGPPFQFFKIFKEFPFQEYKHPFGIIKVVLECAGPGAEERILGGGLVGWLR